MQSYKPRPFVDPENLFLKKNQIFVFLEKYCKLRKNRWASTSHHMLFARELREV